MVQPSKNDQPIRLWGGRFTGATDPLMDQYNESLSVDRVFYAQDIKGSIAYARANVKTGILTQEEFETIERGLGEVLQEWEEGKFKPAPGDEGKQVPVHSRLRFRWTSSGVWLYQTLLLEVNG
jgi:argininosuccinate lyase